MAAKQAPPSPPRLNGDKDTDFASLRQWYSAFYQNSVIENRLLDPNKQFVPDPFDPNNLPSPTDSSIANAQQTANEAHAKIVTVGGDLQESIDAVAANAPYAWGQVTVSDASKAGSIIYPLIFGVELVMFVQVLASAGTPPDGAFIVASSHCTEDTGDFTLRAAPGAGNSVTFRVVIFKPF